MPIVRIEIIKGKDETYRKNLLDSIHEALMNALGISDEDRFQRLYELDEDYFERSPSKTNQFTLIEITMFKGRSKEVKAKVFSEIIRLLGLRLGIKNTDIFIVIHEPQDENWGLAGKQRNGEM